LLDLEPQVMQLWNLTVKTDEIDNLYCVQIEKILVKIQIKIFVKILLMKEIKEL
jgi:hypothetical protein